jgi:hypothetical protein
MGRIMTDGFSNKERTYSCTMVFAKPHPKEKMMKTATQKAMVDLRPNVSLSFATTTREPNVLSVGTHWTKWRCATGVCYQVRSNHPTAHSEPVEVVCDGYQARAYYRALQTRQKQAQAHANTAISTHPLQSHACQRHIREAQCLQPPPFEIVALEIATFLRVSVRDTLEAVQRAILGFDGVMAEGDIGC